MPQQVQQGAPSKRAARQRGLLTLLGASGVVVCCATSQPRPEKTEERRAQSKPSGESKPEAEREQASKPGKPEQYPPDKKPEGGFESPEGVDAVVATADIREPRATYSGSKEVAASPIYFSEVTVSLDAGDELPESARGLLRMDFDDVRGSEGLLVVHLPADRVRSPSFVAEVVDDGVRFRQHDGAVEFVADPFVECASDAASMVREMSVLYDHVSERFLIAAVGQSSTTGDRERPASYVFIAVSDDADPRGKWFCAALETQTGKEDFKAVPVLRGLVADHELILIRTQAPLDAEGGSDAGISAWIVQKGLGAGGFYSGGQARVHRVFGAREAGSRRGR